MSGWHPASALSRSFRNALRMSPPEESEEPGVSGSPDVRPHASGRLPVSPPPVHAVGQPVPSEIRIHGAVYRETHRVGPATCLKIHKNYSSQTILTMMITINSLSVICRYKFAYIKL